jgi:hypothetical protein
VEFGLFVFKRLFTPSSFTFDRQVIAGHVYELMINVRHYTDIYIMHDRFSTSFADSLVHMRSFVGVFQRLSYAESISFHARERPTSRYHRPAAKIIRMWWYVLLSYVGENPLTAERAIHWCYDLRRSEYRKRQ